MPAKKMAPRRRTPKTTSLYSLAEGYFQANLITKNYLGTNPVAFVLGDAGPSFSVSGGGISLIEIVRNPELLNTIGSRLMNPEKAVTVALQAALGAFAFRAGRRLLRRPLMSMNKAIKPLALGVRF